MNIIIFSFILSYFSLTLSSATLLPPIPEEWTIRIENILNGIRIEHWLNNYRFLAPLRIKPNQPWNALIEANWAGPSLVDPSLLTFIELVFTPLDSDVENEWSGDKKLIVSSFDLKTNIIKFSPQNNKTFMISPKNKTGLYTNMFFTLSISGKTIPQMYVSVNTRVNRDVEVTCSDGIFCNGEERLVRGKCQSSNIRPCEDPAGNLCRSYECIESDRQCSFKPKGGEKCKTCNSTNTNVQLKCSDINYECGWNSDKTLYCGNCSSDDYVCSKGKCLLRTSLGEGSCNKPYQLLNTSLTIPVKGISDLTIYGDLSLPIYTDHVLPACHPAAVPDVVYVFKIASPILMGMEIQMLGADGSTDSMDTVLALTDENCQALPLYSFCGDDSSPPGGLSSRVFGRLENGTYKLVATGFTHIPNNPRFGPYKLLVKFYPNCLPQCEGNRKCGPDGCGGVCGTCTDGKVCHLQSGQCRRSPCMPECSLIKKNITQAKTCGDDGCGGVCGACNLKNSEICLSQSATCKKVALCNNLRPECLGNPPSTMTNPYCGHDCLWHDMKEPLGDLMPNGKEMVLPSIEFEWRFVSNRSCAITEGCYKYDGDRLIMRFDTFVHNVGNQPFSPPEPEEAPNLFQWSPCHAHYHFDGFASFNLFDLNSTIVVSGGKRGYCMADSYQTTFGEHIACDKYYSCDKQGVQPGWADLYRSDLDCQWIDITDVEKEKWYVYEICSNIDRKLAEAAYSNNCKRFPVYVPNVINNLLGIPVKYEDVLRERNIMTTPHIEQEPGSELIIELSNNNLPSTNLFKGILNYLGNIFRFLF